MSSTRMSLTWCIALLFAVGAYGYPKELIGTWVGSCQQLASTNMTGMNSICTGSPKVLVAFPYMISYMVMKSKTIKGGMDLMYGWSQDATITEVMMGNMSMSLYTPAFTANMTYALAHATSCGPMMYCITSKPPGVGPVAFMASAMQVGEQMMYTEQGIYNTATSMATKKCPTANNMPLYCDEMMFNYICTAHKLMM